MNKPIASNLDGLIGYIFFIFLILPVIVLIIDFSQNTILFFKDFGLPYAALVFSFGSLYLEKEKQSQNRIDTYYDRRLEYFYKLQEMRETFVGLSEKQIEEVSNGEKEFKETMIGQLYRTLFELKYEGSKLFDKRILEPLKNIETLLETKQVILRKLYTMLVHKSNYSGEKSISDRFAMVEQLSDIDFKSLEKDFINCDKIISSYLQLETGVLPAFFEKIKNWIVGDNANIK